MIPATDMILLMKKYHLPVFWFHSIWKINLRMEHPHSKWRRETVTLIDRNLPPVRMVILFLCQHSLLQFPANTPKAEYVVTCQSCHTDDPDAGCQPKYSFLSCHILLRLPLLRYRKNRNKSPAAVPAILRIPACALTLLPNSATTVPVSPPPALDNIITLLTIANVNVTPANST